MADWDIPVGTTLIRRDLHTRWGGSRFGGMEPARRANSVFLFTKPSVGETFGYKYDGWHSDGTFHYTGDGQEGDQSRDEGGNRALLRAADLSRAVRLFRSEGVNTTYLGEFALADPPYYQADAPDRNGEMRSVLVFRLEPLGDVLREASDSAPTPSAEGPQELPLEATNIEAYIADHPDEPAVAVRREAELVRAYSAWLAAHGESTVRHRIPIPDGGYLYTDVFNKATQELIEAKASAARVYIRAGLGQLLDYSRYLPHKKRAVLLPQTPAADLVELLHSYDVGVIWRSSSGFSRSDPADR